MSAEGLYAHLGAGVTTVARAWAVERRDGAVLGFTDHDADLAFEGIVFRAGSGLSARALAQVTGLAVDNTEAMGALSDAAISEADLMAGRYDGAGVRIWAVNWAAPEQRALLFRGSIGEVVRAGGAFQAELRGLAEALNQPRGRVYRGSCPAVLGDAACRVDLDAPGLSAERPVAAIVEAGRVFRFTGLGGVDARWFEPGGLGVLGGAAAGLAAVVKNDRMDAGGRVVELWAALRADVAEGDAVRLEAGCDKRAETCRLKFGNFVNFRGFPHMPGDDWLTVFPARAARGDG